MTTIIHLKEIQSILKNMDLLVAMEEGFIQYSNGEVVVPPVGELLFEKPKGETHIKYGFVKNKDYYVIKVASGFYDNPKIGLASSQGIMLLFSQKTGQPICILLDQGYLTDVRTAIAGILVAKYFAPNPVAAIGVIGTGTQAKLQLQYLRKCTSCKTVWVWGRNKKHVADFKSVLCDDFDIHIAENPAEVAQFANLIITATPSKTPLLSSKDILPGTHITAVGSDTSEKQELESSILAKADMLVVDSITQSQNRGEVFKAIEAGCVSSNDIVELGRSIQDASLQRTCNNQISVVDLTGVAIQDIVIAKQIFEHYKKQEK